MRGRSADLTASGTLPRMGAETWRRPAASPPRARPSRASPHLPELGYGLEFEHGAVALLDAAEHRRLRREQDRLGSALGLVQHTRRLVDLPAEDQIAVQAHLKEARAAKGMGAVLVVVPHSNHRDAHRATHVDEDQVAPPWREGCEP